MYSPSLTISMTSETFHLERNKMDIGRYRLLIGLGIFLIPMFLVNATFASVFHLKGTSLVVATSIVGLVLINVMLFLLRRVNEGRKTLIFGFSQLRIIESQGKVQLIPFSDLEISLLTYGMDEEKRFPAIRIKAKNFGCMTIGSNQFSKEWQPTKEQIDCTTYLIPSNEEWQRFLEIINHLK